MSKVELMDDKRIHALRRMNQHKFSEAAEMNAFLSLLEGRPKAPIKRRSPRPVPQPPKPFQD